MLNQVGLHFPANHTRKTGVPSRTLTSNLTLRTRPLCALSYGDERFKPLAGLFHRLTPGALKNLDREMKGRAA